ncbi:peptidoglycan-binding protein [Streptomyces sp. NPDC050504]|uniref:peptidoglycan-binding protein n=1 Tax=Streptomyces sp. NPDC050504 TaxID=3365618 RepID=UPI0037A77296
MTVPVFEEYEPADDCACAGCVQHRRALAAGALPPGAGGHPGAQCVRRALVLVTAAGVVMGSGADALVGEAAAADGPASGVALRTLGAAPARDADPATPQGGAAPLHGRPLAGPSATPAAFSTKALRTTTRADIINRAKRWVSASVPYSMEKYWSDGYRQDCSGFVSMAWNLGGNEWTGSLAQYGTRIAREDLQPGDILLFHNPANPTRGSHVTIFGGWTDYTHTYYIAYEQARPRTRKQATPMAYWNNSARYVAYRYKGLAGGTTGGGVGATGYPGVKFFGPGASNKYVTRLGQMLVDRGAGKYYSQGPGPRWGDADRRATRAFQRAQGWTGAEADGLPGPHTWRLLVDGGGKDIGDAAPGSGRGGAAPAPAKGAGGAPGAAAFPGRGHFKPGQSNAYVEQLGRQLVKRGFGKHYTSGPGPRWSEADRRNVEAFQRAQGWGAGAADGYPGPETWRRLFG